MSRKIKSNDPLGDIDIDSELIPVQSQSQYPAHFSGGFNFSQEKTKKEEVESDEEFESGDEGQPKIVSTNREAIKALIDTMTPDESKRYELFRRAHLPRGPIKKMLGTILGQPSAPSTNIIVAGCGKLFVGEIVELALNYMKEIGDSGPIMPHHIKEAYYRYQKQTPSSHCSLYKPVLFK